MKAIVYTKYGSPDVLKLKDVAKPIPKDNEVLVKVLAASVNYGNLALIKGEPFIARLWSGLLKPKHIIPGGDMAGRVEAVGKNVKQFKPGDEVFADLCECGWGAFAEYAAVHESELVLKPVNLSFEESAAVPMAAVTALQGLRDKGKLEYGQKVLINGASGGVGTFAVQIAKAFGAEVTGVCSTKNVNILKSIGADYVIDYTREDFTQNKKRYDLILAANGYHPISAYKRALNTNGVYVMTGGSGAQIFEAMIFGPWLSMSGNKKMCSLMQKPNRKDLLYLKGLLEAGKVKPVVDRCYKLSEVPEAIRYFEKGHAQGKVVITM